MIPILCLDQVGTGSYSKVHRVKYVRSDDDSHSLKEKQLVAKVLFSQPCPHNSLRACTPLNQYIMIGHG